MTVTDFVGYCGCAMLAGIAVIVWGAIIGLGYTIYKEYKK